MKPEHKALLEPSASLADAGRDVGRDPRKLEHEKFVAAGHKPQPLLRAIRGFCIQCCNYEENEVRKCTAVTCQLWPYRMATNPLRPKRELSEDRKAALRMRGFKSSKGGVAPAG